MSLVSGEQMFISKFRTVGSRERGTSSNVKSRGKTERDANRRAITHDCVFEIQTEEQEVNQQSAPPS